MTTEKIFIGRDALHRKLDAHPGVYEKTVAQGIEEGDGVWIDRMLLHSVLITHRPPPKKDPKCQPQPQEPTTLELASNFAGAMTRWTRAGFATASAEQYAARSEACDACEMWDGSARLGLGKCKAPGCGCTSMKRWLATEKCPLDKWPKGNEQ